MKNVPEGLGPQNRSPYCGDPGALVSYLYNDGSADELAAIAAHVQACGACTAEIASLGDTRELISAWSPPQTELGLTLTSDAQPAAADARSMPPSLAVTVADIPWWRQSSPVWMQAVAATMVFAAGMAIGTSGRGSSPAQAPNAGSGPAEATTVKAAGVSKSELADLEQRLRAELARLSAPPAQAAPVQAVARTDDEALMKRVRALLSESEEKQRGELAQRMVQVLRDVEIQRKVDLATLQNNIGQIQGATGAELRRQNELYNQLINRAGLVGK